MNFLFDYNLNECLPEHDYVTFGYLPSQYCLSVCNVRAPYSAG